MILIAAITIKMIRDTTSKLGDDKKVLMLLLTKF